MTVPTPNNKVTRYLELVEDRKICRACKNPANPSQDLTNPSEIQGGAFDSDEIGPWSRWQGNLDAELMVVAQDWGDVGWFVREKGCPTNYSKANTTLVELVGEAGFSIGLPYQTSGKGTLFFTNAVLCMKQGNASARVPAEWFRICGAKFLRPLIDIVRPMVIACVGKPAYETVLRAHGIQPGNFREAVDCQEPTQLPGGAAVFAMYHCGALGQTHRNRDAQRKDWRRIHDYFVEILLSLGRRRFGDPSPEAERLLRGIADSERLARMIAALPDAPSWEALLATR
jgi:DNA polymerase